MSQGFVIGAAADSASLERIQHRTAELAAHHLGESAPREAGSWLDRIHERLGDRDLNALRLAVLNGLNAEPWVRPAYFRAARPLIEAIVGNELCMQRRINLSIQLPGDESSLLATHSDVWSGDSPFEIVVWVPLVDVFATKSMYLLPPDADRDFRDRLPQFASAEALYRAIESRLIWMDLKFGQVLVFNQTLMHGNRVNREATTRWSMNCRFKSVLSPYADKKIGEFFETITLRPATRVGMEYRLPGGFDG